MKGKLKPIVDLVAKRQQKKRDKMAHRGKTPPRETSTPSSQAIPFERPTTANLLRRDIASDADVEEALQRVEQAKRQMESFRSERHTIGDTARKYSSGASGGDSNKADILVIRHDD